MALEQLFGNRGTMTHHKRFVRPLTFLINSFGTEFFARATFAREQNRHLTGGDIVNGFINGLHEVGRTNQMMITHRR